MPVLASYNTLPNAYKSPRQSPALQPAKTQRPNLTRRHARTGHQSNIRQLGSAVYINDIRLDVPMHQTVRMEVMQTSANSPPM